MALDKNIIEKLIKSRIKNRTDLDSFKREISKAYKISCPSNVQLLKAYHKFFKIKRKKSSSVVENLLKTRPIRSLSGIVNISVLTKPYPCPGKCIYCPKEKGIPKSYLSGEPAVERAKKLKFDPYLQVKKRVEMLEIEGHPTDKIELRIVGGTWSYYPEKYQEWFVKKCFQAANNILKNRSLEAEQKLNEKAKNRIIGLSIETRPDFINIKEIKRLRKLGVTMVELGIQTIYDDVLKLNLRGHTIYEATKATKLLKDAGFKVLYQMMPNLPGSNLIRDEKMFKELFSNPDFCPDLLKIYPCALLKEAPLYDVLLLVSQKENDISSFGQRYKKWKKLKYRPYAEKQLIDLIKKIKKEIPYYVRIQRISRDIPSTKIVAGAAKISNLRQILKSQANKEGWQCKCIRCREVGGDYDTKEKIYLFRIDYNASDGKEIFLSFENKNRGKLYSLLRLRIPSLEESLPILKNSAVVREIHTYGPVHPIGKGKLTILPQHKGLGKKLIKKAEEITKEFGEEKIAVISGIGARNYWRRLGYKLENSYMVKNL